MDLVNFYLNLLYTLSSNIKIFSDFFSVWNVTESSESIVSGKTQVTIKRAIF